MIDLCKIFVIQTFSGVVPEWVQKTRIVKKLNKMLVNHLGLTLSKEDLQNVVDLMEPYGQISNGIELLNPPLDVRNYFTLVFKFLAVLVSYCHLKVVGLVFFIYPVAIHYLTITNFQVFKDYFLMHKRMKKH